jgi:hypothetical protein
LHRRQAYLSDSAEFFFDSTKFHRRDVIQEDIGPGEAGKFSADYRADAP